MPAMLAHTHIARSINGSSDHTYHHVPEAFMAFQLQKGYTMNDEFKRYRRKEFAELRPVTQYDLDTGLDPSISISQADLENGSPCLLDMIARNPKNHNDQWLVAAQYFVDNFEREGGA